jgi:hypothetical protein
MPNAPEETNAPPRLSGERPGSLTIIVRGANAAIAAKLREARQSW